MRVTLGKYEFNGDRIEDIHIDPWDTWSMDHTLACIIVPMLKQLKEAKDGSPMVDDEDVPHMPKVQNLNTPQYELFANEEWLLWQLYHDRWDWVFDEMLWAMEQIANDVDVWDNEQDQRIQNGLRLFGKYFTGLWS